MRRFALLLSLMATCIAANASAYVLELAESGEEVHWKTTCVTWWMEANGCSEMSPEETREVLRASYATWDRFAEMYVDFEEGGVSCVDSVGFDKEDPVNVAIWRGGDSPWPYTDRVVGLTTLTFDKETGEIVDADMEFNEEDFVFSNDETPNTYDLQHAVTHEVGHMLGLGHSRVPGSIMNETTGPGAWNKRELSSDDEAGVAANHALSMAPPTEPCGIEAPQGSFESPQCSGSTVSSGCSAGGAKRPLWWALLALSLLGLTWRRRLGRIRLTLAPLGLLITLALCLYSPSSQANLCEPYRTPGGDAIFWPVDEVVMAIDSRLPEGMSPETMRDAVHQGLGAWTDIPCLSMTVNIRDDGEGFSDCPGEVVDDGVQCIYWSRPGESWPYGIGLIAVTLVHHNQLTAEIVDTDMAINASDGFTWSSPEICDPESDDHDLLATLTHEFGHFFGLNHSSAAQSVMEASTRPGDCDKRTLADFDEACLCDTLKETKPPIITPTPDVLEDTGPVRFDVLPPDPSEDTGPPQGNEGCTTGSGVSGRLPLLIALFILLGSARLASQRRRQERHAAQAH